MYIVNRSAVVASTSSSLAYYANNSCYKKHTAHTQTLTLLTFTGMSCFFPTRHNTYVFCFCLFIYNVRVCVYVLLFVRLIL